MLTENEFIETYLKPLCRSEGSLSLSDDAAILEPSEGQDLILSKDMLIAGHHFFETDRPEDIAYKALAVNLSDIAAKGATPIAVMLGIAFPKAPEPNWAKAFCIGLNETMENYDLQIIGGDTTGTKGPLVISVTIIGQIASGKMVKRSGAKSGDYIIVSGTLGDAALGYQLHKLKNEEKCFELSESEKKELIQRYLKPTPRCELAALLKEHASSAMDISDGLVADLEKLTSASNIGANINIDDLPLSGPARKVLEGRLELKNQSIGWGDDYEILATISPENSDEFRMAAERLGIKVTKIGECVPRQNGITYTSKNGEKLSLTGQIFQHF